MIPYFDQSQLHTIQECEFKWLEKYVRGLVPTRSTTQARNDAMAIGSLAHAGLEVFERDGSTTIPQETIDEIRPTPDTLAQAQTLVAAYTTYAERGNWPLMMFEEPLVGRNVGTDGAIKNLMAKVDFAFYVDQPTVIRIGVGEFIGSEILQPGYYIQEYKTKDISKDRGSWIKEWQMKPQADFQLDCLAEHIAMNGLQPGPVNGILVTVLEYERPRPPMRTCRRCHEKLPFASFLELPSGQWQCVLCGRESTLKPVEHRQESQPLIWKTLITRTQENLNAAVDNIILWCRRAIDVEYQWGRGNPVQRMNNDRCLTTWGAECDYYSAHSNWMPATAAGGEYVQIDTKKYMARQAPAVAYPAAPPPNQPGLQEWIPRGETPTWTIGPAQPQDWAFTIGVGATDDPTNEN